MLFACSPGYPGPFTTLQIYSDAGDTGGIETQSGIIHQKPNASLSIYLTGPLKQSPHSPVFHQTSIFLISITYRTLSQVRIYISSNIPEDKALTVLRSIFHLKCLLPPLTTLRRLPPRRHHPIRPLIPPHRPHLRLQIQPIHSAKLPRHRIRRRRQPSLFLPYELIRHEIEHGGGSVRENVSTGLGEGEGGEDVRERFRVVEEVAGECVQEGGEECGEAGGVVEVGFCAVCDGRGGGGGAGVVLGAGAEDDGGEGEVGGFGEFGVCGRWSVVRN